MLIRPMEYGDLDWVRRERNRPECRMWFRQPELITKEKQEKWFNDTDMVSFMVETPDERIGVVSLSHIDNIARKCEFSIMIIPEQRHKGLGKKALWKLLDHAFNDLNMNQVYSDVFDTNCALDFYLQWGFKAYGTLPNWYYKDGKYINSIVISITKDEYNNSLKQTISREKCGEPLGIGSFAEISVQY